MYPNLDAEQARRRHTNQYVASCLGISRVSYENRKKNGRFTVPEIKVICKLYKSNFEYIFDTPEIN